MKELIAGKNEAGSSLKKVVSKYLDQAPTAFFYKMLRKKNITLNKKKADGTEILKAGDTIQLFLSDETIDKFHSGSTTAPKRSNASFHSYKDRVVILYEDMNIIAAEKPAGMLSQKAAADDYSVNEYLIDYLISKKELTQESLMTFRPSVVNRLDRNTSGIILFGKSLKGSQVLSEMIRERRLDKYYLTAVQGSFPSRKKDNAYLCKDETKNLVQVISEDAYHKLPMDKRKGFSRIETEYRKLCENDGLSLLEVKLITGKSHQIRAHLKHLGFSVVGDNKYKQDQSVKKPSGIRNQLLHAHRVVFHPDAELGLAGKQIRTEIPIAFQKLFPDFRF